MASTGTKSSIHHSLLRIGYSLVHHAACELQNIHIAAPIYMQSIDPRDAGTCVSDRRVGEIHRNRFHHVAFVAEHVSKQILRGDIERTVLNPIYNFAPFVHTAAWDRNTCSQCSSSHPMSRDTAAVLCDPNKRRRCFPSLYSIWWAFLFPIPPFLSRVLHAVRLDSPTNSRKC